MGLLNVETWFIVLFLFIFNYFFVRVIMHFYLIKKQFANIFMVLDISYLIKTNFELYYLTNIWEPFMYPYSYQCESVHYMPQISRTETLITGCNIITKGLFYLKGITCQQSRQWGYSKHQP